MSKPKPDSVCVVSTDIKSSSKLWSYNDGVWMKNHLLFHHAIITYWAKQHQFNITHNSPEGDAFIMYKKYSKGNKPDYDAILQLQILFEQYRRNKSLTISEFESGTIFESFHELGLPGIYIRVGVAYGGLTEKSFKGVTFKGSSFNTDINCNKNMEVFQGHLVHQSEEMEIKCKPNEINIYESGHPPHGDIVLSLPAPLLTKLRAETENGINRLFQKYSTKRIETTEHATAAFIKFYEESNYPGAKRDKEDFKKKLDSLCKQKTGKCYKIKKKRDGTLMLYFTGKFKDTYKIFTDTIEAIHSDRKASDAEYNEKLLLLNVGLSFGNVNITELPFIYKTNSILPSTGVCYHKDIFGDPVNLAARAAGLGLPPAFLEEQAIEYFNCEKTNIVVLIPAKKTTKSYTSDVAGLTPRELNCATHMPRKKIKMPGLEEQILANVIERSIINAGVDGILYQRVYAFKLAKSDRSERCSES